MTDLDHILDRPPPTHTHHLAPPGYELADGGCAGRFVAEAKPVFGQVNETVKRSGDVRGFKVLAKRWIVERAFSWVGRYRRLSKDYESLSVSSGTMIHLAMVNLMLHRMPPG